MCRAASRKETMAVKSGFQFVLFLHLIRFGFVESFYECVFSGTEFVTFGKDVIDGRMPCRYTLLGTNDQDHIDSFRIEVNCDERKETPEKSVIVTALRKKIQLNVLNVTVDQIPQKRDVSIIIPPLRMDVTQNRVLKKVSLNIGISVLYTPPDTGKVIVFDNYTGSHNLNGACGNPWPAGRVDHDAGRRRLYKFLNDKPKYPTKYVTPHSAKVKPKFEKVPSVNGHLNNRRNFLGPRNGAHRPQTNPKKPDNSFQNGKIYSRCYSGGFWHINGSIWMAVDCSMIFTCINSFVTRRKSQGCSEFADCVKIRQGATCRCRPGFIGNGLTCAFLQDKIAPKYRPGNAQRNNFATPVVPADRLITTVEDNLGANVKGRPTYSDWRNRGRKPPHNNPWGRRNRNNFIKKDDNKKWRPSKTRPFINAHEPRGEELERQTPTNSFQLNAPPESPDVRRDPIDKSLNDLLNLAALVIGDRKPVRKRPHAKTAPNNRQPPRTQPGKMRNEQKAKPKIFGRPNFNKNDRSRQPGKNPGKEVIKPLKQDGDQFKENRGHPRTLEKNKGILDTMPKNNTFRLHPNSYPSLVKKNEPGLRYVACKRENNRMTCKLVQGIRKNDKTVPDPLDPKQILGNRRMIPLNKIPNNFRSHGKNKPQTNPAASPNNGDKPLRNRIGDIINPEKHRNPNNSQNPDSPLRKGTRKHSPNNEDPISRTLTNPKRTDLGPNRPNKKNPQDHKPPYLNHRRYKQPIRSDIKRVTEILRRVSGSLNGPNNKKVTNGKWNLLPRYSSQFTTTNVRGNTFSATTAGLTSAVISFIDPVSKKAGDGRFFYSSSISPTGTRRVGTLPTQYTSVEQPLFDVNRRVLPNNNTSFPSRKGDIQKVKGNTRKKPLVDNNSVINKHRYPTADGTIDGLVVEPPPQWPLDRLDGKPAHRNQNIPMKNFLPKYLNKDQNQKQQNRPSKNRHKPNTGSKVDSVFIKCKLDGSGCTKIKNATGFTGKGRTLLPRKNHEFPFPFTGSSNTRSDQESTQATTMLYTTGGIMTSEMESNFVKNDDTENWKPQQPKPNPERKKMPRKNFRLQPSSIVKQPAKNELKREKCDNVSDPSSGLRYKIMKKIKESVEEIGG